jgi:hypothetical protein
MSNVYGRVSHVVTAGLVAAIVQGILILACSLSGIFQALGLPLEISPVLPWLYQRMAWGGLWGLLFLLPIPLGRTQVRGLVLGLVPAAASLLFFLPLRDGQGWFGLRLGPLMPVVVVVFGLVWGAIAGMWLARVEA